MNYSKQLYFEKKNNAWKEKMEMTGQIFSNHIIGST